MHVIINANSSESCDYDETKAIPSTSPLHHTTTLITPSIKHYIPKQKRVTFQEVVKYKPLHPKAKLPSRATKGSIGYDICSTSTVTLHPHQVTKVNTGVSMSLPDGVYCRIAPRSGLALKGISVEGGVIDSDYTGEYLVLLRNNTNESITIQYNQKIAQLIFERASTPLIETVSSLPTTTRNKSGFGSTDINSKPSPSQSVFPTLPPRAKPFQLVNRKGTSSIHRSGKSKFQPNDILPTNFIQSASKLATVNFDEIQYMSKIHLKPPAAKDIATPSDMPTASTPASSNRIPSSEPVSVTLSRDNLSKAVGFRQTDFLIKHLPQLSNQKVHIQRLPKSPFIDPGETASMKSRKKNKDPLKIPSTYSDTWHIDIGYGPCTSIGGYKYVLLAVDKYSRYKICYGLKNLTDSLLNAMKRFVRDVGQKPRLIRTDFDNKLMAGQVEQFLIEEKIKVESSPPYRQHQNGLVERNWQSLVNMSRNWMTSNLLPSTYWYFALKRASEVGNILPTNHIKDTITTPHELVFGSKVDYRSLFPMFSLAYVKLPPRQMEDGNKWSSKTIKCIAVGRCPKSDGMLFYIPGQKQLISCGEGYKFDPSSPSGPHFNEKFDNQFYFTTRATTEAAIHRQPSYQLNDKVYVKTTAGYTLAHVLDLPINDDADPYTLQDINSGAIIQELSENIFSSNLQLP